MNRKKIAIVLFNLGGPDRPESIKPFLLNLFRDPAILRVPRLVRPFLAQLIARRRVPAAKLIYAQLGGRSPLLEMTVAQARAIEAALPDLEAKCFIAMRYWHPFSLQAAREVAAWNPDEILLVPLYPQFSTTSTGSSLTAWRAAAAQVGLVKPVTTLCCYYADPGFIAATAAPIRAAYDAAREKLDPAIPIRILYSAHGLPEIIIREGDPYQFQIESSAAALTAALAIDGLDAKVSYQSRATPQQWLTPSTEDEITRAAEDKVGLLIVPIAFVSEHSETLVELDIEYRELAEERGVPFYARVPTQNLDPGFIEALANIIRTAAARGPGLCSFAGARTCPVAHGDCPHAVAPQMQTAG